MLFPVQQPLFETDAKYKYPKVDIVDAEDWKLKYSEHEEEEEEEEEGQKDKQMEYIDYIDLCFF